jgi:hypothetical protein
MDTPNVGAQADFWLHFDIVQNSYPASSTTLVRLVEFLDSGGVGQVRLTGSWGGGSANPIWQMERWDGSAWVSVGNCTAPPGARQTIDIHVVSNTASGSIDLYMSGTKRITSPTVDLSGFTGIEQARFWGITRTIPADSSISQVIMATETTIGMRLGTIPMTGNGASTAWTGDYTNIDEIAYNDGDEINSGTANDIELYTGTPVPAFTGYTIRALAVTARAKKSGSGPAQMQLAIRSGGTNYFSSTLALDVAYGGFCKVWETNPATTAAWQSSELSALQYGVKSIT